MHYNFLGNFQLLRGIRTCINKHLKREAENHNAFQFPDEEPELFKKFAKNQNKTKELLNDLWKTHGNFSYINKVP